MNQALTRTYTLEKIPIEVAIKLRVISIDVTPYTQKQDLQTIYKCSWALVSRVKADYQQTYQQSLKISHASLVAEIWGHLLVFRLANWLQRSIKVWPFQKLSKSIAFRSGVIDCGEAGVDSNRWVWDLLAPAFSQR